MPRKSYGRSADTDLSLFIRMQRAAIFLQREVAKITMEHGLTFSQFSVLEVLYHKGDLNICQIMSKILATSGNLTVVIRNLEKLGLIKRLSDPADKRAYLISLTEQGRDLTRQVFPKQLALLQKYLSIYTEENKLELIEKLDGLRVWQSKEENK